jgi:WD40 repeat protein
MPPSEPLRVFISYARKDGSSLAQRLQSDLAKAGFDAWLDTQRINGGRVWSTEIEGEIDARDVTVAVLTLGSYKSAICRGEQIRTMRKGKRLIPVLGTQGADVPVYIEALQYRDFTDDANYAARLAELLADIRGNATATLPDTYRKTRVAYLTAPPRVANYLERPETLHALRDALFAEDHRQPIALTALAGMGGIGKTVLAKALTEDEVVQRAFPDGIVWITAGKERKRDFIEEMHEAAKALGDDLSGYDNALACENQYRTTIANKAALIVVDDVWSVADIKPLLAESRRSRFLFTTRDAAIGRFVGAHEHRADLLDVAQSRELLASWANLPVAELPAAADEVIAECGRLPLALSVVGAMLRGESAEFWRDTLDLLRKADLSAIQEQLPEGQESFFKAVEVSFQSLKPEMQEQYKGLAVLLEEMAAPLPILQTLWDASEAEARRISRNLVDRSLAQRHGAAESIRLHDLQLDYVRAQFLDKEALELIHGALRLSSNVIAKDPGQFASQMVGRLLPHQDVPFIDEFNKRVADGTRSPWLRPLHPALYPSGTGLLRILEGHKGMVNAVAVTPDGQVAVSASDDRTLKVWDLASGRELRTLTGHSNWVTSVAVTPDGKHAVSASGDKTLKMWELGSGGELHTLTGHSREVYAVALTPDGLRAVSASGDRTLILWDLKSGRKLRTFSGHLNRATAVAVTTDGQRAVSASWDRTLKVWELASGREMCSLTGHSNYVTAVAVTVDGQRAVSASRDRTLKVWDLESGREMCTLTGHASYVYSVTTTPVRGHAVSASGDQTLKVWDLATGREVRTLIGHALRVNGVAVTPNGQHAVSASDDKTLKVWDLGSGRDLHKFMKHARTVRAVAVTPDGQRAVSGSTDKTVKVWELSSGRDLHTLAGHSDWVRAVAATPDGQRVVSGSDDKTLKVWDLEKGRNLRTLAGHDSIVTTVTVTPDGQCAVSASADETLKVWELESGQLLRTLNGHSGPVYAVGITPDGLRIVSGSRNRTLKLWELDNGRELTTLTGHSNRVAAVAVMPDGQRAVSASYDGTLKLWDLGRGRELYTFTGHRGPVYAVALTPHGQRAVSASADNTVKLWDLGTGEVLATFTCDSAAYCCALSDTPRLIIAGDAGGHLHFLRLEEPKSKN